MFFTRMACLMGYFSARLMSRVGVVLWNNELLNKMMWVLGTGISTGLLGIAVSTNLVVCLHDKADQTCEYTALVWVGFG